MFVLLFPAAIVFYLSLSGRASWSEFGVGALAALLTSLFALKLRREAPHRFAVTREHLAPLGRALAALPVATARTAAILARSVFAGTSPGHAYVVRFEHGPSDDDRERGRRAGAMLYACLAPDGFVLRMPEGRDEVLVHTIGRMKRPADPRWLA